MRWFSSNVLAVLLFALASGCASRGSTPAPIAAPREIRAAARLDATHLVLLTGGRDVRTIHIVRLPHGEEERTFGVAPQTTTVEAVSARGPLLLGYGVQGGRSIGALETWTLAGRKLATYPLPIAALDVTHPVGGAVYVLLGNGSVRAAQRVETHPFKVDPSVIPLPANSIRLRQCSYDRKPYLLSSGGGKIAVTHVATHKIDVSEIVADEAECVEGRRELYALLHVIDPDRGPAAAPENQLMRITLPGLLQAQAFPAPRDAITLVPVSKDLAVIVASSVRASTLHFVDLKQPGP